MTAISTDIASCPENPVFAAGTGEDVDASFLYPCFIGAHAENHELFEQLLLEFIHDHMYWRRNFHPDDPPPIPTASAQSPEYQAFVAQMKRELLALGAMLKGSIPLFSPRYMGHMLCDPLMPGLLAQMMTLPYNPNNVSEEAAPATVGLEIQVGLQLARMLGYGADPARSPCAFGHLTSGGTLANYEALYVLRAAKFFPLALKAGLGRLGVQPPAKTLAAALQADDRSLANLSSGETIELHTAWRAWLVGEKPDLRGLATKAVQAERIESLGSHGFHTRHPDCPPPVIVLPRTAHYSWNKAAKLMGFGESSLVYLPTQGMRLDPKALERTLAAAHKICQPVLCAVGVLGSTEYGTLDPVDELVAARERWREQGLGFAVHVDAAWGGYLTTLFRGKDGSFLPRETVAAGFEYFPSERVHAAFAALCQADSVTVDPHKLGYLPYGVGGAFVCRDHRLMDFVVENPPYLGPPDRSAERETYEHRFRRIGRFVLEGSKPGAAAAAAYVTHRTLPLDAEHFGRLLRHSVQEAEHFYDRILALRERLSGVAHVSIPIEPDSNLVCVAFNPASNRWATEMNAFVDSVFEELRVNPAVPLQARKFFSSATVLHRNMLTVPEARRIAKGLGLDPNTFTETPRDAARDADGLRVLRHTLMNPWLRDETNGIDYVEKYCEHLEALIRGRLTPRRSAGLSAA